MRHRPTIGQDNDYADRWHDERRDWEAFHKDCYSLCRYCHKLIPLAPEDHHRFCNDLCALRFHATNAILDTKNDEPRTGEEHE
jgi:hypothetical protein